MSSTLSPEAPATLRERLWHTLAILALRPVPFWTRSVWRRIGRVLVFLVYAYLTILLVLLLLENVLLYSGAYFANHWAAPPTWLKPEDVHLTSADGGAIHAWWYPPPGWTPDKGAVLYSHGNGRNLSGCAGIIGRWRETTGRAVLIYDYPGYGKSDGSPNEKGSYAAIDAAYAWLVKERQVPPREIINVGSSLGAAMAIDLASRQPCRALVVINAFTSFPDMASVRFPWLPGRWLVRNQMHNERKIALVDAPVFITHGTSDEVVPFAHGERLFAACKEPKAFLSRPGDPHLDPNKPEFFAAVNAFLAKHPARGPIK